MKTWNDYKEHVKTIDPATGKDLQEIEEQSATPKLDTVIKILRPLGLRLTVSK